MKNNKQVDANKEKQKQNKLITSDQCEKCKDQCIEGKIYLERLKSGKCGKGLVCKKLKNN